MKKISLILIVVLIFAGCATWKDVPQGILGVSTKSLENGKADSIYQIYPCTVEECFNAVLDVAQKNKYYVFMKDQVRGLVVLMAIPGCVDTTEVGVFFSELPKDQGVKVELSSRSSPAKKTVAKLFFDELTLQFKK